MDENETPENNSSNEEEESDHPVCDAAKSDEDEMSGESESELPEEPDWPALEENAFSAGSSTESEEDDCKKDDSGNYIR